jgi:endonuclease/exonuclease/phosphatase family metal-dependent hydrolase
VLTWNVYHGRDRPPNDELFTWRGRLLRRTEHDASHVQVNRVLLDELAQVLAAASWSVCLLQETPPPWAPALARRSGATFHLTRTSRNQLMSLRRRIADWNPDLIASNEGGSNVVLVRPPWRMAQTRSLLLNPFPGRGLRERRRMAFVRIRSRHGDVCVANIHASTGRAAQADVMRAAQAATGWARDAPLVLGGDFNMRPRRSPSGFAELESRFGLAGATAPDAIDHLLARGLEVLEPAHRWPPRGRELEVEHERARLRLRLSDHDPVEAMFGLPMQPAAPVAAGAEPNGVR